LTAMGCIFRFQFNIIISIFYELGGREGDVCMGRFLLRWRRNCRSDAGNGKGGKGGDETR
jgi:hypothetical protein